jgi:FkbM family methyltransferase
MRVPPRLTSLVEDVLPAPLMRRLRVAYFDERRRRYRRRVVEHTYGGVRHRVLIASEYAERYDYDWPELPEVQWLKRRRLTPGARVFDIGASVGVIAMMLADAVGPDGVVVALEALPEDADTLARNAELNGMTNLVALHAAVARKSGTVPFGRHGSVDDGSRRWGDRAVPAYSIDDLARRYGAPDVVFVDVEGYELEALRGATETLASGPDWMVEVHDPGRLVAYGATSTDILDAFLTAGYEVSVLIERRGPGEEPRSLDEVPAEWLSDRFFALATRGTARAATPSRGPG